MKPAEPIATAPEAPRLQNPEAREVAGLLRLLELEADVRRCESLRELVYHLANESREVLGFRQAFVFRDRRGMRLDAVSSVANFDQNAPLNHDITRLASRLARTKGGELQMLDLTEKKGALAEHAFNHALWMPFVTRKGRTFGGALLLKETPWSERFMPIVTRVRDAYSFAWQAKAGRSLDRQRFISWRLLWFAVPVLAAVLALVRVPLTVLAPVEVTGRDQLAITAPIDGAIDEVTIAPNTPVEKGTVLVRLDDTELRNSLDIAESRVIVAQAAFEKLQSASFTDRTAARDLKVAEAELGLARAERDLAQERLSRVEIKTPIAGVTAYDDPKSLAGRPVVVGERIMDVIDPAAPEFTIRLPVDDSIVIRDGTRVRVFLDSDPLAPIEATLLRSSYHATTQDDGSYGYTLVAEPEDGSRTFRIGGQGTAQVFGDERPVFFILFRRPLSWLRQTFGL